MEQIRQICSKWMLKAFEAGTKQSPFDAGNSEYWSPMIDLKWSKQMAEEIDKLNEQNT